MTSHVAGNGVEVGPLAQTWYQGPFEWKAGPFKREHGLAGLYKGRLNLSSSKITKIPKGKSS